MKRFEEDEKEAPEEKFQESTQTNPEYMKKLQCLESSEASSNIVKTFVSDSNFKNKLAYLAALKKKEESKNNNIIGSQSETNNIIQKNNKDIIIINN